MNLANAVEYDAETRCHRFIHTSGPGPGWLRPIFGANYVAPPNDGDGPYRRALRAGGREVVAVLQMARRLLTFNEMRAALPHVEEHKLDCRLSYMAMRGHISRFGEKHHFTYGLPGRSTSVST